MHKFEHKTFIQKILNIDEMPESDEDYAEWIKAGEHINLLLENESDEEIIVYASGPFSYMHSLLIPIDKFEAIDKSDIHSWSARPHSPRSAYVSGGGKKKRMWVEHGVTSLGAEAPEGVNQLVYCRHFEGWTGEGRNYIEILQEFVHLSGIHWRPEYGAYCKIDNQGDISPIVSITGFEDKPDDISLVTIRRASLDEYLAVSDLVLIRLFDFTLVKFSDFNGYGDKDEYTESVGSVHYRQRVSPGHAAYTNGFQILYPREGYDETIEKIQTRWFDDGEKKYVTFVSHDWRNKCLTEISTNPNATTNYFDADKNELPFELSPAFFKPEVVLKYKADRDKYTIKTRRMSCRGAWELKSYDVNTAGQIHAYISDLRKLPYNEQLHWLSYNEAPKAPISDRARTTDFLGQFTSIIDPLDQLKKSLADYEKCDVIWWKITDIKLWDNLTTPITSSRDEWAEGFMDLSKLVVEGLQIKAVRQTLKDKDVKFEREERSIKLLERLWENFDPAVATKLTALREIQHIRSKAKGHSGSSEAVSLSKTAIATHGNHTNHFNDVVMRLIDELECIDVLFQP